jgi:hypothetical protein
MGDPFTIALLAGVLVSGYLVWATNARGCLGQLAAVAMLVCLPWWLARVIDAPPHATTTPTPTSVQCGSVPTSGARGRRYRNTGIRTEKAVTRPGAENLRPAEARRMRFQP